MEGNARGCGVGRLSLFAGASVLGNFGGFDIESSTLWNFRFFDAKA